MKEVDWLSPSGSPKTQVTSCLRQTEHKPEKCADLSLGASVDSRGAVYFPVRLCFVTLSTMSVSRSIIIWRQRRRRGGGRWRQPPLSAALSLHQYRLKLLAS